MKMIAGAGEYLVPEGALNHYREQLREATMSLGTYSIPAGGTDDQQPHREDEVYFVVRGRGAFTGGSETVAVEAGTTLFVAAEEPHRFHDISEDLTILVVFSPPYTGRG